jgi:hypothetical protein
MIRGSVDRVSTITDQSQQQALLATALAGRVETARVERWQRGVIQCFETTFKI